jgi:nucleoside-diphosphate-sugar epimerase
LLRAATADIVGQPVNVGSGQGTPILELAERILQLVGSGATLDRQPARSVEVARFTADVTRMRKLLGLEPPADALFALPQLAAAWGSGSWND